MKSLLLAAACAAILTLAPMARAHIVVTPGEVAAGQSATFEMRVPTELHVPTTRLRLQIPDGFSFSSIEPVAGWKITIERYRRSRDRRRGEGQASSRLLPALRLPRPGAERGDDARLEGRSDVSRRYRRPLDR